LFIRFPDTPPFIALHLTSSTVAPDGDGGNMIDRMANALIGAPLERGVRRQRGTSTAGWLGNSWRTFFFHASLGQATRLGDARL
jgi:hypothetical protein